METKAKFKTFLCPIHSGEPIVRFATSSSDQTLVYCVECLLEVKDVAKDNLTTLTAGIQEIYSKVFSDQRIKLTPSSLDPLLKILESRDSVIKKLTEHIDAEKKRIDEEIRSIFDTITRVISKAREKILSDLDGQLETLKRNYAEYQRKLIKFSKSNSSNKRIMDIRDLCDEINECKSTADLSERWRSLLVEMEEMTQYLDKKNKSEELLTIKLQDDGALIKSCSEIFPRSLASQTKYFKEEKQHLMRMVQLFMGRLSKLDTRFLDYLSLPKNLASLMRIDSKIITPHDVPKLESLCSQKISNLKLKLRISRENFDLNQIRSTFDHMDRGILLVRTTENEVVGYFKQIFSGVLSSIDEEQKLIFSLTTQTRRFEEERVETPSNNSSIMISTAFKNNLNDILTLSEIFPAWPSRYFQLSTDPYESSCFFIYPTLDDRDFYEKKFLPTDIEVFELLEENFFQESNVIEPKKNAIPRLQSFGLTVNTQNL